MELHRNKQIKQQQKRELQKPAAFPSVLSEYWFPHELGDITWVKIKCQGAIDWTILGTYTGLRDV